MRVDFKIPAIAYDGAQIDTLWDNHEQAIEWYEKHLGVVPSIRADKVNFRFDLSTTSEMMTFFPDLFNLQSIITSKRLVHLYAERVFLEKLPTHIAKGRVDGPARLYFLIEDRKEFENYHQMLTDNGILVSPIGDGFGTFHMYDPDGNRLNFWHY